jgi:2-keto-3-deoxy-L-rhamnonate aldolase RhmA
LEDSAKAEIIAVVGFDRVVVDLEHSQLDLETVDDPLRAIDICGVSLLVRLTSKASDQIKHMMDGDA